MLELGEHLKGFFSSTKHMGSSRFFVVQFSRPFVFLQVIPRVIDLPCWIGRWLSHLFVGVVWSRLYRSEHSLLHLNLFTFLHSFVHGLRRFLSEVHWVVKHGENSSEFLRQSFHIWNECSVYSVDGWGSFLSFFADLTKA